LSDLGSTNETKSTSTSFLDEIGRSELGEIHISVLRIVGDESAGGGLQALDGNKPEPAHGGHVAV